MDVYEVKDRRSLMRAQYLTTKRRIEHLEEIIRLGEANNYTRACREIEVENLKQIESDHVRLGYGERDTDGNFRLKEME